MTDRNRTEEGKARLRDVAESLGAFLTSGETTDVELGEQLIEHNRILDQKVEDAPKLEEAPTPFAHRRVSDQLLKPVAGVEVLQDSDILRTMLARPEITAAQAASSDLIAETQAKWESRAARGFQEYDQAFQDSWLSSPLNWTTLELQALQTGYDLGTVIEFEAAFAAHEELSATLQAAREARTLQVAKFEVTFENNDAWLEFESQFGDRLGREFMDAFAYGVQLDMPDAQLSQLISEFGLELQANPKLLDDEEQKNELLGRMIVRSHQLMGQIKADEAMRDRGVLAGLGDIALGIADPLLGPSINFDDQGALSGLGAAFQPFEDMFIDPAKRGLARFWAHTADPENPFRPHVTFGQNAAISAGQDPNTWGYSTMSGALDASVYIVADPLSYVGGFAKGFAASRYLPAAASGTKATRTLKAAVPFFHSNRLGLGRQAVGLGWTGHRGFTARVTYNLFAKQADELVQTTRARKFADNVIELAQTGEFAKIDKLYPGLRNVGELTELARWVRGADEFLEIFAEHMKGTIKAPKTVEVARRAVEAADSLLEENVMAFVRSGTLDLADVAHLPLADGRVISNTNMVADIGENGVGTIRRTAQADGARVMAWTSTPNLASLDNPWLRQVMRTHDATDGVKSVVSRLRRGISEDDVLRGMTQAEVDDIARFVGSLGFDGIRTKAGTILVSKRGFDNLVNIVDGAGTQSAGRLLSKPLQQQALQKSILGSAMSLSDELFWVDSLPKRSSLSRLTGITPRTLNKVKDQKSWWGAFRQNRMGWMTGQIPKQFDLFDSAAAKQQIKMHGRFAGMSDERINLWLNEFAQTPTELRAEFFGRMLMETAQEVGDPRLLYGIRHSQRGAANVLYPIGDDMLEIARGESKSRVGLQTGKPHEPGMLGKAIPAWDATMYDEIRRFRTAKARGGRFVRGRTWTKTNQKRQKLVDQYRRALNAEGMPLEAAAVTDDDLWAMAYATINDAATGGVNGLGRLSTLGNAITTTWGFMHRGFTLSALALRPIAWPLKVVFGEETIRSQLSGLPSMLLSPNRWFSMKRTARAINRAAEARGAVEAAQSVARQRVFFELGQAGTVDDLLTKADELVPGWRQYLDPAVSVDRRVVNRAVNDILDEAFRAGDFTLGGRFSLSQEASAAVAREQAAIARLNKIYDTDAGQKILDAMAEGFEEINADLFSEVAAVHKAHQDPIGLNVRTTRDYAVPRVEEVLREAESPFMQFALDRALAVLTPGMRRPSLKSMTRTSEWRRMRSTVYEIARGRGKIFNNDLELAEWYFDIFYRKNLIEGRFGQFMKGADGVIDPERAAEFMRLFRDRKIKLGDQVVNLTRGNQAVITQQWGEFLDDLFRSGQPVFEPRFAVGSPGATSAVAARQDRNWYALPADAARWVVRKAGSETTQRITRQPAFLAQFQDYFNHYRALGWDEAKAAKAAGAKAALDINELMYNMENAPEALQTFNRIVPFGAAMFEVGKVWTWQLPVLQGGAGLGHIQLAWKVKRFEDALINLGIMERDEDGQTTLRVSTDAQLGQNPFGASVSNFLARGLQLPALLGTQLMEIRNYAFGSEGDDGWVAPPVAKQFELTVGSPLKFDSDGLFAFNRFSVGQQPAAAFLLSQIADNTWLTSEYLKIEADGSTDLVAWAAENEIDVEDFFDNPQNRQKFKKAFPEIWEQLKEDPDQVDLSKVTMPAGTVFNVPNTNALRSMFDDVFFPFGRTSDFREMYTSYTPGAIQQMLRSFGIQEHGDHPLGTLLGPLHAYNMETAMIEGMQYAEFVHGFASASRRAFDEIGALQQEAVDEGYAQWETITVFAEDENGDKVEKSVRTLVESEESFQNKDQRWIDLQEKLEDLWEDIDDNDQALIEWAASYGATREFNRGLTNLFVPGSPRAIAEQAAAVSEFYDARNFVEALIDGQGEASVAEFLANGYSDPGQAMKAVNDWLTSFTPGEGFQTSAVKREFLEANPRMGLYLTSRRAYDGDPFPEYEEREIEDYVRDIREGNTRVVSPDVFIQRYWRTQLSWDKFTTLAAEFGDDSFEQGANRLWNWQKNLEISAEFKSKRAALDYYDHTHQDGAYAALRDLEAGELPEEAKSIEQARLDDAIRRQDRAIESVDQLIQDLDSLDIDPLDKREMEAALFAERAALKEFRDTTRELQEDFQYFSKGDQMISLWFETIYRPYKEARDAVWDQINDPDVDLSDQERSALFGQIRDIENTAFLSKPELYGMAVPNPIEWAATYRDDESKRQRRYRVIGRKVEWLNLAETIDLVNHATAVAKASGMNPVIPASYLPTSVEGMKAYREFDKQLIELKRLRDSADPNEKLTKHRYNKAVDAAEAAFRLWLEENNRGNEAKFLFDFTPAQRLEALYLLPDSLEGVLQLANTHRDQVLAAGEAVGGEQSRLTWDSVVWPEIDRLLQGNPTIREDLIEVGTYVNKKSTPKDIVETVFLGMFNPF